MEDRETPRTRKYGESKTTRIMMATVPHITSGSGLRKFQADGFLLDKVYKRMAGSVYKFCTFQVMQYCKTSQIRWPQMPGFIMQFRRRIGMLLLMIVVLLPIGFIAVFLVEQPTVSSNDPYSIYKEQNYLDVKRRWYNYCDSGELSVFLICIMYINVWCFHLPCF